MTYITYTKGQYSDYKKQRMVTTIRLFKNGVRTFQNAEGIYRYRQPPRKIPLILPKPDFMPSYLVRTSDMKVVKASEIQEGYCALSYSWNQSGEIIKNDTAEDMERADKGKHKIIYPARTVRKKPRGRKRIPRKVKFVKFEKLTQEICKDFNIKYIWYDQMCIDQNNKEEKLREIHQMHKIYSNAYCTIALVPELTTVIHKRPHVYKRDSERTDISSLLQSQWMKRMWTLEEAILSSKIVLIGNNIHCWTDQLPRTYFPIFRKRFDFNIRIILHYAHMRTSTKKHDHVFALANIFPEVMKEMTIDYDQDIQELMIQFYGLLAKKDISILWFGSYSYYKTMFKTSILKRSTEDNSTSKTEYNIPIQKFDLPSWTGVYGEHHYVIDVETPFTNYTVNGRTLQVICAAITNDQHHTENLDLESIKGMVPPLPGKNNNRRWHLVIRLQPQGSAKETLIRVFSTPRRTRELDYRSYKNIAAQLHLLSHFMSIKKTNLLWTTNSVPMTGFKFSSLTEPLEDSAQYVILAEILFGYNDYILMNYPVIKKDGDYYKAIGVCSARVNKRFHNCFDGIALEKQTFKIY